MQQATDRDGKTLTEGDEVIVRFRVQRVMSTTRGPVLLLQTTEQTEPPSFLTLSPAAVHRVPGELARYA